MATLYETLFAIRSLAITASGWTDVVGNSVIAIDCNTIIIYNNNSVAVSLRTNPANSSSEVSIPPGQGFEVGGNTFPGTQFATKTRFSANSPNPVCSLKSSSGSINVLIECVK